MFFQLSCTYSFLTHNRLKVILNIKYSSGEKEQVIFNKHDTFVVGRAQTNTHSQLRGDRYISRHHFILEVNPPKCTLKDLGSTNGTKLNGVKLAKGETIELSAGDEIYVGRTTLSIDIQKKTRIRKASNPRYTGKDDDSREH